MNEIDVIDARFTEILRSLLFFFRDFNLHPRVFESGKKDIHADR